MACLDSNSDAQNLTTSASIDQCGSHDIISRDIGHYGLIAALFIQYNLINFINTILPKTKDHYISHGECLLCLMLNALSFHRRALYKISDQMSKLPIKLLFGRDIDPKYFNDDVLGRFLEAVFNYGPSEFFVRIVDYIYTQDQTIFKGSNLHGDITNIGVYGAYETEEGESNLIVRGHAKDGRDQLKQISLFVLSNCNGLPLFLSVLPGNCSDNKELKANFIKSLEALKDSILSDEGRLCFISDAAFYSKENIAKSLIKIWLTRVPESLSEAKELVRSEVPMTSLEGDIRYSFYETSSSYGGIEQKWVLFHSSEMAKKQMETFEKRLKKAMSEGNTGLNKIGRRPFACEEDAKREAEAWIKKTSFLKFQRLEVIAKPAPAKGRGRPKINEPRVMEFFITGELAFDEEVVEKERRSVGRFILASNDLTLSAADMLSQYKGQGKVERVFRFMKSHDFRLSEIILKNENRIQGLGCLMGISSLIYGILEIKLRQGLEKNNETLLNASNKPSHRPTLLQAINLFKSVIMLFIYKKDLKSSRITINFSNADLYQIKIVLRALGPTYEDFYFKNNCNLPPKDAKKLHKILSK